MLFRLNDDELYGIFVFKVREVLSSIRLNKAALSARDLNDIESQVVSFDLFSLLGKTRPINNYDVNYIKTAFNQAAQVFEVGQVDEIVDFEFSCFDSIVNSNELAQFGGVSISLNGQTVNILDLEFFLDNHGIDNTGACLPKDSLNLKKVVVVDASFKNRLLLRSLLKSAGVSVSTFSDVSLAQKFVCPLLSGFKGSDIQNSCSFIFIVSDCVDYEHDLKAVMAKVSETALSKNVFYVIHSAYKGCVSSSCSLNALLRNLSPIRLLDIVYSWKSH